MKKRILMDIMLDDESFTISLDPVSRKNLNVRIKPDNMIHVSKPMMFSKQKLIQYLEDHKQWILIQSTRVNALHHNRNNYITDEYVIVFDEKFHVKDYPNIHHELYEILGSYIQSERHHYDRLLNEEPDIKIKKMKGKWGYCIPSKNKLVFNINLVHYPKRVIDYVILHEYTHLKIPNHSKEFYEFIEKEMPEYKESIKYLKQF